MKLITPPGMLLTAAVMAILAALALLTGWIENSWLLVAAGIVAAIGTYGAAMVRPWSRVTVYALTASLYAKLGLSIFEGVTSGYYRETYDRLAPILLALLPSVGIALVSLACCLIVYRQFRDPPAAQHNSRGPARE